MLKEKQTKPLSGILEISAFVTFGLIVFLCGLSLSLKLPFFALLAQIKESYFFPFVNSAIVGDINGVSFHIYVCGAIGLFSLLAIFIRFISVYRQRRPFSFKDHSQLIPQITCIVLIWLVILQTINRVQLFRKELKLFGGQSIEAKQSFIHLPYEFANYSVGQLSGRHRCGFITDMDITRDPDMPRYRQLAYFLFPTIDIRDVYKDRPIDCMVISRKNAAQHIPEGFEIKGVFNPSNILAVKKNPHDI